MITYTPEIIKEHLIQNQAWLERAIVALYKQQTLDEQKNESVLTTNHRGFSKPDAKLLSYYAKWILSGKHLNGKHLNSARNKTLKYAKQLTKIANHQL
jgi:hypothetical protein